MWRERWCHKVCQWSSDACMKHAMEDPCSELSTIGSSSSTCSQREKNDLCGAGTPPSTHFSLQSFLSSWGLVFLVILCEKNSLNLISEMSWVLLDNQSKWPLLLQSGPNNSNRGAVMHQHFVAEKRKNVKGGAQAVSKLMHQNCTRVSMANEVGCSHSQCVRVSPACHFFHDDGKLWWHAQQLWLHQPPHGWDNNLDHKCHWHWAQSTHETATAWWSMSQFPCSAKVNLTLNEAFTSAPRMNCATAVNRNWMPLWKETECHPTAQQRKPSRVKTLNAVISSSFPF